MNRCITVLAAAACTMALGNAHSAIVSGYGAVADVGTFDDCAAFCLRPGGLNDQVVNGGEFASAASAAIDNATATSTASVEFTGDVFGPVLRARSESPVGSNDAADALATAIQAWTYTGGAAQDYAIEIALSGAITEPDGSAEGSIEGRAAVYLFDNATFGTNFSSFILEEVALSGTLLATEQLFLTPALDLRSGMLNFTLNPGDEVFVWLQLQTKSERGAIVDAQSTFDMSFTSGDTSALQATITPGASVPVPIPPALWLVVPGLAAMGASRRRRP